ncbi:GNAT family N-acetyltransferase [Roseibium alexandrii]|uniref:Putative acetyltransferase n=1 Tax=Roseibium alexandrii TaxID=388408 RepID=A0A0M7AFP7_9HYPH|nr:GNAT family N-acetyltransferase [Roseibium alexandrii]CTQ73030.1 putative acetyltransferase [Roseibium alexandrii]
MTITNKDPAIRRANLQDMNALKQCIDRAYAPVKTRLSDLPDVSAGLESEITDNVVYVAETDEKLIGCAILAIDGELAQLVNIAVDPEYGGRGAGRRLIEVIETHARDMGAIEIQLATHIGMPENVALYAHLGWSETGRSGSKVGMSKPI